MGSRSVLPVAFAALMCVPALAQGPTYGIGRTPTAEEIRARDISIGPTGEELPPGKGSAKEGAPLFMQKCAACHGASGAGGLAPMLIKPQDPSQIPAKCLAPCINVANVMALHSPYATTIWDYVNRAMGEARPGGYPPPQGYGYGRSDGGAPMAEAGK